MITFLFLFVYLCLSSFARQVVMTVLSGSGMVSRSLSWSCARPIQSADRVLARFVSMIELNDLNIDGNSATIASVQVIEDPKSTMTTFMFSSTSMLLGLMSFVYTPSFSRTARDTIKDWVITLFSSSVMPLIVDMVGYG